MRKIQLMFVLALAIVGLSAGTVSANGPSACEKECDRQYRECQRICGDPNTNCLISCEDQLMYCLQGC